MADVVVAALLNKTVDIAANLIISEGSRLYWLSEDIKWLECQLSHMQSYLKDAEAKKVADPKMENLLKQIRDLAYDVEDIFDTFLPKTELHRTQSSIKRAASILSEPISNKLETLCLHSEDPDAAGTSVIDLSKYKQLMKLTIAFKMQQFPQCHDCFPPNLVKLTLFGTELIEDPMQVLKKLPKLKILILSAYSYVGRTLDYSGLGSFTQLQVLQLQSLWTLEELVEGDQGIPPPNLRQVLIQGCHELGRIPESLNQFLIWR